MVSTSHRFHNDVVLNTRIISMFSASGYPSDSDDGHTVLRSASGKGNGVVSVVAYHSSRPSRMHWSGMERWLQKRCEEVQPGYGDGRKLSILGYQWRVLRFNDVTRQSTAKVMATYNENMPRVVYLMQQPRCLAVPYVKSVIPAGLTTMASCNFDIISAVQGKEKMHILCIGHDGGSLPLFLPQLELWGSQLAHSRHNQMTRLFRNLKPLIKLCGKAYTKGFSSTKQMLRSLSLMAQIYMI